MSRQGRGHRPPGPVRLVRMLVRRRRAMRPGKDVSDDHLEARRSLIVDYLAPAAAVVLAICTAYLAFDNSALNAAATAAERQADQTLAFFTAEVASRRRLAQGFDQLGEEQRSAGDAQSAIARAMSARQAQVEDAVARSREASQGVEADIARLRAEQRGLQTEYESWRRWAVLVAIRGALGDAQSAWIEHDDQPQDIGAQTIAALAKRLTSAPEIGPGALADSYVERIRDACPFIADFRVEARWIALDPPPDCGAAASERCAAERSQHKAISDAQIAFANKQADDVAAHIHRSWTCACSLVEAEGSVAPLNCRALRKD